MVFCGQCGLKIPPSVARCPRCGTAVDTMNSDAAYDDINTEGATIASLSYPPSPLPDSARGGFPQAGTPSSPGNPQKLVLQSDDTSIAGPSAATSRVNAQPSGTPPYHTYPVQPTSGASYPGYPPQSGIQYPTQNATYPGYIPYPGAPPQNEPVRQRSRGRIVSLIVILLGLLVLLAALSFFAYTRLGVGHNLIPGGTTSTPGIVTTPTTPTASPEQQAQAIVTQYYDDVNNKNYEAAYNLWVPGTNPSPTLPDFIKGFQYTLHDDLTITKTAQLNDGTVQVSITIVATEQTTTGGTKQSTYQGYNIVGQQNGVWKIQSGKLSKV